MEAEQVQIQALEMQLLVPNILFFRHLAGRALKKQISVQGSNASSRSEGTTASNQRSSLDLAAVEGAARDPGVLEDSMQKEAPNDSESSHGSGARCACWACLGT